MNDSAPTPTCQIPTNTTTVRTAKTAATTTTTTLPTTRTTSSTRSTSVHAATQTTDPALHFAASNGSASIASISVLSSSSSVSNGQQDSSSSPRIVFGPGTVARLPNELGRLNLSSPLIVSSPSRIQLARHIQALIPNIDSRILDSALVNVPTHVVDDAVARITGRDCVISVGGTTAVGLAKSIASLKTIPHICIPTTYGGSEMAPMLGDLQRKGHRRRGDRRDKASRSANSGSASASASSNSRGCSRQDSKAVPNVIIYDEDLTASAPQRISAPSCVEALAASRSRRVSNEDAQWSYIHLPGV